MYDLQNTIDQKDGVYGFYNKKYCLDEKIQKKYFFSCFGSNQDICIGRVKKIGIDSIDGVYLYLNENNEWQCKNEIHTIKLKDIISLEEDINSIIPDYKSEEFKIQQRIKSSKTLIERVQNIKTLNYFAENYGLIDILMKEIKYYIKSDGLMDYKSL